MTGRRVLVLGAPSLRGHCDVCTPGHACPLNANVLRERGYPELTRIVCGADSQLVVLGWLRRNNQGTEESEEFDTVICRRSDTRRRLVQRLRALSGPDAESRVTPTRDILINLAVQQRTSSRVLCMTFAVRESKGRRLSLFVLTEKEFCEFEVCFAHWIVPPADILYDSGDEDIQLIDDDHGGHGAQGRGGPEDPLAAEQRRASPFEMLAMDETGKEMRGTVWEDGSMTRREQALSGRSNVRHTTHTLVYGSQVAKQDKRPAHPASVVKGAQKLVLQQLLKVPLPQLQQVDFESEEAPVIRLVFGGAGAADEVVQINFFDDAVREKWRRALAFALHRQADTGQWRRGWDTND